MRGSLTSACPTVPSPGSSDSADRGTPASRSTAMARAATSGVCSAGLAATALPAASAAATCPVKIASGKFHGEMAANTPRPPSAQVFRSPVGPASSRGAAKSLRACSAYQRQWSAASRISAMPSARVLPPSRASRNSNSSRDASIRSAARSSTAARWAPPAVSHSRQPRASTSSCASICEGPASSIAPTTTRRSAGLRICRAPPITAVRFGTAANRCNQRRRGGAVGKIDASRIDAVRIEIARQSDAWVAADTERAQPRHGIGDDRLFRHGRIDQAMHEAGVGAVLQQPAHQIGEQILMRADRCIDAHRIRRIVVERLAHAVQALHLERVSTRAFQDEGQAVRVVRGECGVDCVAALQHAARTGEPAHIGRGLAGEHRIVGMALHLRQLDLAVPVGALHQPRRNAVARPPTQCGDPVDQRKRALLVTLHGEAEPVPAGKPRVVQHRRDDVEADLQPVGLLRIDGEPDVRGLRREREIDQRADQSGHAARGLQRLVARMQRRELDRNARPGDRSPPCRAAADGADRIAIGEPVALRIGMRFRSLAQHVEAVAQAPVGACQGFADGAAHHELPRQHAHAATKSGTDHRFTEPSDDAADDVPEIVQCEHTSGQHERPGGGVHRKRVAVADMPLPIGAGDTVLDQRIGGGGVGDAQQRLGEAQEGHAFRGAEAVLGEEVGDVGARPVRGAGGMDERAGTGAYTRRRCGKWQQRRQHIRLGCPVEATKLRPVVWHTAVIASEAKQSP